MQDHIELHVVAYSTSSLAAVVSSAAFQAAEQHTECPRMQRRLASNRSACPQEYRLRASLLESSPLPTSGYEPL